MKKRIFITATNTDVGKTYTTKLLLREYASRGLKVGVIKPVETGVVDGKYPDGDALLALVKELNPLMQDVSVSDIVPISYELPAAPFIASGGKKFDSEKVLKAIEKLEDYCDVLLIEGAGGVYVPLDLELMIVDLIKLTQAVALLVTHCSLGCINDTLLSKKSLQDANIAHVVVFNPKAADESFEVVSRPYFDAKKWDVLKTDRDIDTLCDVLYNL
ncbi:MAG: dethiobiotin synthase [Sulfurimonas sp.]